MLRVEALMHQAENTGRWDDYRALNGTYLESYNRARRAGVSEQRMLSIGQ